MANVTYVALTTVSGSAGYWIVLVGEKGTAREAVRAQAAKKIAGVQYDAPQDVFTDTALKNLAVLPLSNIRRKYAAELETYYEDLLQAEDDSQG